MLRLNSYQMVRILGLHVRRHGIKPAEKHTVKTELIVHARNTASNTHQQLSDYSIMCKPIVTLVLAMLRLLKEWPVEDCA